jgi:hypothetical protein
MRPRRDGGGRRRPPTAARRAASAALALALGLASTLGLAGGALADDNGNNGNNGNGANGVVATAAGPVLYGQVVAASAQALIVALGNGDWVAVNLSPATVIVSQSGGPPAASAIVAGDWVLVSYAVQRQNQGGTQPLWLVARAVTYSTAPISTGAQTVHITGVVAALYPGGGFAVQGSGGALWVVRVLPQTVVRLGGAISTLALLQVGDRVQVWGTAVGHNLVATRIQYSVAGGDRGGKDGNAPHRPRGRGETSPR